MPNGCSSEGARRELASMVEESACVGLPSTCGTHRSAESAITTMMMIQIRPIMASLLRRRRFHASPHRVRDFWGTAPALASADASS